MDDITVFHGQCPAGIRYLWLPENYPCARRNQEALVCPATQEILPLGPESSDTMKKQKKLATREERNKIIVLLLVYSTMYNSD